MIETKNQLYFTEEWWDDTTFEVKVWIEVH